MSEWKKRANERRDFRHTHDAPEIARPKGATKRRPWKVYCSMGDGHGICSGEFCFGKYATEKRANQAITAKAQDKFFHSFRIQGPIK